MLLQFRHTIEYITPVVCKEYRASQPLSFLIFHAMQDAVGRGFRQWNWGGTWRTQHTLYRFKAGFGAIDRPYSYLVVASEESHRRLRAVRRQIGDAFPYYYVYPFAELDGGIVREA